MVQFRFFSRSKRFFEMFGEAARNIHQGAKAFERMLHDFQGSADQWRAVEEYEHEGDKITHRIVQTLHQSSMTPADREDIHKLAATLDDVLDLVEGAAFRMAMYKVAEPTPDALRLAAIIVRCTEQIVQGVSALPDVARIQPHCIEINRLENEADEISRAAIAELFVGSVAPLDVIKWKEIYETMETATDRAEDVANLLEEIVLKRS
jgi:predicted phosphate transport protein (TIGR00153 family)